MMGGGWGRPPSGYEEHDFDRYDEIRMDIREIGSEVNELFIKLHSQRNANIIDEVKNKLEEVENTLSRYHGNRTEPHYAAIHVYQQVCDRFIELLKLDLKEGDEK